MLAPSGPSRGSDGPCSGAESPSECSRAALSSSRSCKRNGPSSLRETFETHSLPEVLAHPQTREHRKPNGDKSTLEAAAPRRTFKGHMITSYGVHVAAITTSDFIAILGALLMGAIIDWALLSSRAADIVRKYYGEYDSSGQWFAPNPAEYHHHTIAFIFHVALMTLTLRVLCFFVIALVMVGLNGVGFCFGCGRSVRRILTICVGWTLYIVANGVLVVFSGVEAMMLAKSGVHVFDLEISGSYGIRNMLYRRVSLGVDLPPYTFWGASFVAIFGSAFLLWLSSCLRRIGKRCSLRALLLACLSAFLVLYAASAYTDSLLTEQRTLFRHAVPFNVVATMQESKRHLIPVYPRRRLVTLTTLPSGQLAARDVGGSAGDPHPRGYPVLVEAATGHAPPGSPAGGDARQVQESRRRLNVLFITRESTRIDQYGGDYSQQFDRFLKSSAHTCAESDMHYSNVHTTEMFLYLVWYSLNAFTRDVYLTEKVPSWPATVLRQAGYLTALITAAEPWPFPSQFIFNPFDVVEKSEWDDVLLQHTEEFFARRETDKRPFFLHVAPNAPAANMRSPYHKDSVTTEIMRQLQAHGFLNDTIFIFTGDHGNMSPRDGRGEDGHGQPESSWWRVKVQVPFVICVPPSLAPRVNRSMVYDARSLLPPEPGTNPEARALDLLNSSHCRWNDPTLMKEGGATIRRVSGICDTQPPSTRLKVVHHPSLLRLVAMPTAHIDVLPTLLHMLDLTVPESDPRYIPWHDGTIFLRLHPRGSEGSSALAAPPFAPPPRQPIVLNPRFFPRFSRMLAVADARYKFWFRVSSFDPETLKMEFAPARFQNYTDAPFCVRSEDQLRNAFRALEWRHASGQGCVHRPSFEYSGPDECHENLERLCPTDLIERFQEMFWRWYIPIK